MSKMQIECPIESASILNCNNPSKDYTRVKKFAYIRKKYCKLTHWKNVKKTVLTMKKRINKM